MLPWAVPACGLRWRSRKGGCRPFWAGIARCPQIAGIITSRNKLTERIVVSDRGLGTVVAVSERIVRNFMLGRHLARLDRHGDCGPE